MRDDVPSSINTETAADACAICREDYGIDGSHACALECGHTFHAKCAVRWFRTPNNGGQCPLCRSSPTHGVSAAGTLARCTHMRRRARASGAPVELKVCVMKLQSVEKELAIARKKYTRYRRSSAVQQTLKMMNSLHRKIDNIDRKVWSAKLAISQFSAPGYEAPSYESRPLGSRPVAPIWA